MEKIKLNFFISKELKDKLKEKAEKEGRTVSDLIRQAIIEFLRKEKDENL